MSKSFAWPSSSPTVLKFTHYNRLQGLKLPRQSVDVDDKKCQNWYDRQVIIKCQTMGRHFKSKKCQKLMWKMFKNTHFLGDFNAKVSIGDLSGKDTTFLS